MKYVPGMGVSIEGINHFQNCQKERLKTIEAVSSFRSEFTIQSLSLRFPF